MSYFELEAQVAAQELTAFAKKEFTTGIPGLVGVGYLHGEMDQNDVALDFEGRPYVMPGFEDVDIAQPLQFVVGMRFVANRRGMTALPAIGLEGLRVGTRDYGPRMGRVAVSELVNVGLLPDPIEMWDQAVDIEEYTQLLWRAEGEDDPALREEQDMKLRHMLRREVMLHEYVEAEDGAPIRKLRAVVRVGEQGLAHLTGPNLEAKSSDDDARVMRQIVGRLHQEIQTVW